MTTKEKEARIAACQAHIEDLKKSIEYWQNEKRVAEKNTALSHNWKLCTNFSGDMLDLKRNDCWFILDINSRGIYRNSSTNHAFKEGEIVLDYEGVVVLHEKKLFNL